MTTEKVRPGRDIVFATVLLHHIIGGGIQSASGQWLVQDAGTLARLNDVVMLDSATAVAVGDSGLILRTSNSGVTWARVSNNAHEWLALAFRNPFRGLAVGVAGSAARTTDGGMSWNSVSLGSSRALLSVAFAGVSDIYVGNDSGAVLHSHDDGTVWQVWYPPSYQSVQDLFFEPGDFQLYSGFAITDWLAYRTTDGGNTWSEQHMPVTSWGMAVEGDLGPAGTAFVVGGDGNPGIFPLILRRLPADTSWSRFIFMPPMNPVMLFGVTAPTATVAYACGSGGAIFRTLDGGEFWSIGSGPVARTLRAIDFINGDRGFAVGDSGTILYTDNGGVTAIEDGNAEPESSVLLQNYPNPFNPATDIGFQIADFSPVKLSVYDILGREVATLVNGQRERGTYAVTFDGSDLASGVYLYRLTAGGFTATKRMVLVK